MMRSAMINITAENRSPGIKLAVAQFAKLISPAIERSIPWTYSTKVCPTEARMMATVEFSRPLNHCSPLPA